MDINWTDNAIQDLIDIKAYISRDSAYYASKFIEKIIFGVDPLTTFPEMGRYVPEAQNKSIKELICKPYRIIYRINEKSIDIITIVHSHRDLHKVNLEKWEIG